MLQSKLELHIVGGVISLLYIWSTSLHVSAPMILLPIWINCGLILCIFQLRNICSLNFNLFSISIPKYFIVVTCSKCLLCRYTLISFTYFRFLLNINITLDFSSLKLILLLFDHAIILLNSKFKKISTSLTVSPLIASIRSLVNATAFVRLVNLRFRKELYWMFRKPGPQQDPCGHPLLLSPF